MGFETRIGVPLGLLLCLLPLAAAPAVAFAAQDVAPREHQFLDPPESARPRVWWHWLNGNVTEQGIAADLEWMDRIGVGGVQTFDINFQTPDVVPERLAYMTPRWKDAFRFAAREADRRGLELTIASSAGWSETGGPWVPPEDGMKKLVWAVTDIPADGGFAGRLVAPPVTTGPWQELPLVAEPGAQAHTPPQHHANVAVVAYPLVPQQPAQTPVMTDGNGTVLDAARLTDGDYGSTVTLAKNPAGGADEILIDFPGPLTVRSLHLFSTANTDMFSGAVATAVLEARVSGIDWTEIARFMPSLVPSTIGFPAVTATAFRLRLLPRENLAPIDSASAPGYAGFNYAQYLRLRPIQIAELRLSSEARVNQPELKAGFAIAPDYAALDAPGALDAEEPGVAPGAVIDLSDRLRPDGTLDWQPPPGLWRVVWFGSSLTGKTNHPAPPEATGLEVDKLDGAAVRRYVERYLQTYRDVVGPELMGKRGINAILTDSTEVGAFNWTPRMRERFRALRGYDLLPWLPAITGEIVGSRAQTDRFLHDYRSTIAELHASEHYGTLAAVAHEAGLEVYGEALEGWHTSLGDDIDMRSHTDIPMAAMWAFPQDIGPRPLLIADLRTAAASAHLRGQTVVAAESFTSSRFPWAHAPADLRRIADTEFAQGINRIVIHASPHQPVDDRQPGLSLRHIGQFFTRHETWADMARPWIDYLARCSYLLQQGRFAADVAYFVGEDATAGTLASEGRLDDLPSWHAWDFVNSAVILDQLKVRNGKLVTSGGARYGVLYLPRSSRRMSLGVLQRIERLVRDGATVVGQAPAGSASLADDAAAFEALVRSLWRGAGVTTLGKGRIIATDNIDAALAEIGMEPGFSAERVAVGDGGPRPGLDFVHRVFGDGAVFFIHNHGSHDETLRARFRVSGKVPEIWDAVSGAVSPVSFRSADGMTELPLELAAGESRFVVFRKSTRARSVDVPQPRFEKLAQLDGGWHVSFQSGRGAPAQIDMPALVPLNESTDAGVRHFSGVSSYTTRFDLPAGVAPGSPLLLDLGRVGDLAEVRVNGELAGTLWTAPYRLDIGRLVRIGSNVLEVRVANLWTNRLIGDAQPGATKVAWTSVPMYKADAPLRPAGLIGPVRLSAPALPPGSAQQP